jgi:hypothetical protein
MCRINPSRLRVSVCVPFELILSDSSFQQKDSACASPGREDQPAHKHCWGSVMSLKAAKPGIAATRQSPYNTYAPVPVPARLTVLQDLTVTRANRCFLYVVRSGSHSRPRFRFGGKTQRATVYSRRLWHAVMYFRPTATWLRLGSLCCVARSDHRPCAGPDAGSGAKTPGRSARRGQRARPPVCRHTSGGGCAGCCTRWARRRFTPSRSHRG